MKKGFIIPLVIISIFVFTAAILSWKFYFRDRLATTKDVEVSQLKEQIKLLREDREASRPSPSPTPPPVELFAVLDKTKITSANFYKLDCWRGEPTPDNSVTRLFKSSLDEKESFMHACVNSSLNKVVFISTKNGLPLKIFDVKSQQTKIIGNVPTGGGICGIDITLWSKENDLYYQYFACDSSSEPSLLQHMGKIHLENI